MGTTVVLPPWWETDYVKVTSPSVNVTALDTNLASYIQRVGKIHTFLFGRALEITSGNDGKHVAGSAHYLNKAVDVRCLDLTDGEQTIFAIVLGYFSRTYTVAVFDERYTAAPHWHIQTADSVAG